MALYDAGGTAAGTSSLTGSTNMVMTGSGLAPGSSMAYGLSETTCVPQPVNATVSTPKTFRYLEPVDQTLAIYFFTSSGPVVPVRVVYTLFEIRADGSLKQVGVPDRVPAQGGMVGEYYATGRAGECGQPGRWLIRWEGQLSFSSTPIVKEQCFRVQDAVLAKDPADTTIRVVKYGWS